MSSQFSTSRSPLSFVVVVRVRAWTSAGIFPVFSNGNDGPGCGTVGAPGSYSESYGVGAFDSNNAIASFSSRGPSPIGDGIKPDISAPGVDVRSSVPGGYTSFEGTSMAAPHVTGAVALVISAAPAMAGDIDGLGGLLNGGAVATEDLTCGGQPEHNNVWGHGRLDTFASVTLAPRGAVGTLTGTVADALTKEPLAGATVTIDVDGRPRSTRTGSDGTYSIVLSDDTYDVSTSATGYRPASDTAEIVEGESTTLDLYPSPLPALSGAITNINSDTPVEGAAVTAVQSDESRTTTTGKDGAYLLFLDHGTWEVTYEADNYLPESRQVQATEDGQDIPLDVALIPLPSVSGAVSDANDNQPVVGASVTAVQGEDTRTTTTDEDGAYRLFLGIGGWDIAVQASNYLTETRKIDIEQNGQEIVVDVELLTSVAALDTNKIDAVVLPGESRTVKMTLTNTGSTELTWQPHEFNDGRNRTAPPLEPGAGEVLTSWFAGLEHVQHAEGVGYTGESLWIGDISRTVGQAPANTITEFATDGTPTGVQYQPSWVDDRPDRTRDYDRLYGMAFDPVRGWMCQVLTHTPTPGPVRSGVYCWDPATGELRDSLTVNTYTVGLAYNPLDDTFYVGGIGGSRVGLGAILQVAGFSHPVPGATLDQCMPDDPFGAYGLTYNHTADALWATANTPPTEHRNKPIYLLDPDDCSTLSRLTHPDPRPTGAGGIAIDDEGNLWLTSGWLDGYTYLIDSGVSSNPDVSWLDMSANAGSLTPGESQDIEITLDTAGLEPGVHEAVVALGTNAGRQPRVAVSIRIVVTDYQQGINAGGDTYTDTTQDEWAADQAFDGSWGYEYISGGIRGPRRPVDGTDDDPLYQAQRHGSLVSYRFDDVPDGIYEVEVHFADLHNRRPGQHVFDITSDGVPLLLDCDIADQAGYRTAVTKRFYLEPTNDTLRLSFTRQTGRATVAAIRVTHRPDLAEIPAEPSGSAAAPNRTCATDGIDSGMPKRATNNGTATVT